MNRDDFKLQVHIFRAQVENYRRAILKVPNDVYGQEYAHYETMMNIHRSQINQAYGKIEKYIDKIGGGVGQTYLTAFGDGSINEINSSLSSALQNLDRIIGRLDGMTDKEFEGLFSPGQLGPNIEASGGHGGMAGPGGGHGGRGGDGGKVIMMQVGKEFTPEGVGIKDVKNPHRQYWTMVAGQFSASIKKHMSEIVIGVVIAVIAAGIILWIGWNK